MFKRARVLDSGEVIFPGEDVGGRATEHHRTRRLLVVKIAGHTRWSEDHEAEYVPTKYMVLHFAAESPIHNGVVRAEYRDLRTVVEFPARLHDDA